MVYELHANGTFSVLYSFLGGFDGSNPEGNLTLDAKGNIYGVTYNGGSFGSGTVYRLDTAARKTILYNFSNQADGGFPFAGVTMDAQGNLYGTTSEGGDKSACNGQVGPPQGCGVVYKLDVSGNETVLYTFSGGADGRDPMAGVTLDSAGNLYGTTYYGGTDYGVVFKVDPTGKETVVHNFTGQADGGFSEAGVILDAAGNIYGTTTSGGDCCGVVFKISPSGQQTILYSFKGGADGVAPSAGVIPDALGNLYGTTIAGGEGGGTVFKPNASSGEKTVLHSFAAAIGGINPQAGVIGDGEGNLYGANRDGGSAGDGAVYKLDSAGQITQLYSFTDGPHGDSPAAGLVRDAAGNFYGTTTVSNDTDLAGSVYKIDANGKFSVLHTFTGGLDGGDPMDELTLDPAGNVYCTTWACGTGARGVVFEVTNGGIYNVIYNFTGGADRGSPMAGVLRDDAGSLYGTTSGGGNPPQCNGAGCGVIYKLDVSDHETVLHVFKGPDGESPEAGLIGDGAGNLDGTTFSGGASGGGVVFKLDSKGVETVLYNFAGGADGRSPMAGVVRDAAGNLYGTTTEGGAVDVCTNLFAQAPGCGVVFKLTATGQESVLHAFTGKPDGSDPESGLLLDKAANLYGTGLFRWLLRLRCDL